MLKRFLWKVWLRLNHLTTDVSNDYIAEVSTTGRTLDNNDIAQAIEEEGSELSQETLLDVLDRADRIRRHKLCEGYNIQTGICHLSPRVLGNWIGGIGPFDETKHKITVDATITAEMRSELESVGVEVLGIRDSGAYIGLVTDVTTGKTNGEVTSGGQIIISGEKIKIEPYTSDATCGVFIETATTADLLYPLAVNNPKEIIALLPQLPKGTYHLYIKTRYSNSSTLLKEAREIDYATPIIVV